MRIISIGTDRQLFVPQSVVSKRMVQYADVVGDLHIIVFAKSDLGFVDTQIAENVWLYPTNSGSRFGYIFKAIRIGKRLASQVHFGQTVITAQDPFETGIAGAVLKIISKFPLQIQIHTDAWSQYFQYANILNFVRVTIIAPFVLHYADGVRTVSEKIRRDVIEHTKLKEKQVSVLPIFVDLDRYGTVSLGPNLHERYPQWETIILMSSRITSEKNISFAVKVFKKLVLKYPNLGLVIVGQGPQKTALERQVKWSKLSNHVSIEGWSDDLRSYFKTADIFLNTSLYEGYGMAIIEAGASGCPVVTTSVGVAVDMLQDGKNALICPIGDSKCLYNKLANLIENPHLRSTLGQEIKSSLLDKAISLDEHLSIFKNQIESLHKK